MFSTKFEIVLQPGIDFIQSLVFPLQHRHFLPPLIHLINPHPQDILRLPDILCQIIILHNLILRGPLIMNTLTLVLICECGYRGDIPLQPYDIIVRVVDLVIQRGQVFDGGVDVRVELVVLVLVAEDFLFEECVLGLELGQVFLEVLDFVFDGLVVDLGVFQVGD